jgi:hypothetical protein
MARINLGDVARDVVTKFNGVVTARAEYLTGCAQYCLQPQVEADGKLPEDGRWFDETRLEVLTAVPPVVLPGALEDRANAQRAYASQRAAMAKGGPQHNTPPVR